MEAPAPDPNASSDNPASSISFERMASFPPPGWQIPRQARMSPDGKILTYLRSESQTESQSDEMALFAFDLSSNSHRVLVRASDLVDKSKPLSREEELRRERQRKRIKGVTAYSWAAKRPVILLPLGGNVYLRNEDGSIAQLTDTPAPEIDPKICADGSKVAFVRDGELHMVSVADRSAKQLTKGGKGVVTHGLSDFNGQEEFGEPSGFWWSPQCDRIAYLEVDERHVEQIPVMGYRKGADLQKHRYPRTGQRNPIVKLFVVEIRSGRSTAIEMPSAEGFDAEDQYLGRIRWSHDGSTLYFQRLNRAQQRLALAAADPKTGKTRHILEERDPSWIELSPMQPLPSGDLLWTAWRDQHRHIERRTADGKLSQQLTKGDWDVFSIAGVDERNSRVLFLANKDAPLDRQLYARAIDGSGTIERLSKEPGVHAVNARHPELGYLDIHSAHDRPPAASIIGPDGSAKGSIDVPKADDYASLKLRAPELLTLPAGEGADEPSLHGAIMTPPTMKPGVKYPAILMVYGGPGVQTILNQWSPRLLWQHLTQRGFVVMQIDNRGSKGRGHGFESPIYRKLGAVELQDQLRAAAHLGSLAHVDGERLGIYGHSYGGYMAAMAMLRAPGRFKVGVSGSPVTDWRFYDTGYTERFMGTPQNNQAGYNSTEITADADKLIGKLLLIHALMDENVHFEHSAKLIDALVAADKDFDMLVFPGERHGYRSPKARRYAYRRVIGYFLQHL